MAGEGETVGMKAHIEYKLEKYNAKGELEETIIREDEATPAEAEKLNELLNSLPDQAAE
jgi:hypothetical protein